MSWVAAATFAGAAISAGSNYVASQGASAAATQAAQQRNAAILQEQQQLNQIQQDNAPGQTYLKGVVAGSGDLTPAQQKQLEDLRLSETNQIRGSSIAGSGRSAAALINDSENRFTIGALDTNRLRADSAATGMAGRAGTAAMTSAGLTSQMGKNTGDATQQAGMFSAQSGLATGKLFGSAFGDIASSMRRGSKTQLGSADAGQPDTSNVGLPDPAYADPV